MRIIHLETLVVPTFGLLDNDGNVIQSPIRPQEPIKLGVLGADSFASAYKVISDYKAELQKQLDAKLAEEKKAKEAAEEKTDKSE